MSQKRATLAGFIAILLWSTIVGLIRGVSEGLGPVGGAAMIYTLSAGLLLLTTGSPPLKKIPRAYLAIGSLLFIAYELCLSLSLGYASSRSQAIAVGMVNYLWPGMTVILSLMVNRQKCSLLIIPGILLPILGIAQVLSADRPLSLPEISHNLAANPLSYGLAFTGALIWAGYCVVTQRMAQGCNGITLFFLLTAVTLWLNYLSAPQPEMIVTPTVLIQLLLAAAAMGLGYAAWNIGILYGNVTMLATASYFIPVISAMLAALLLESRLSGSFWLGTCMVSLGSLLCWCSTRSKTLAKRTCAHDSDVK